MITTEMYFLQKPHSVEQGDAAVLLLDRVNALLDLIGWTYPKDPDTGTPISGSKGGAGDGGFRLDTATTGAAKSKHKLAHAVDVYDPTNALDDQLDDELLAKFDLYREHPDATPGWCHLQDIPPASRKRTFRP